jgi:predicted amidohydrolase
MKRLHVAAAQIHSGGPRADTLRRMERQVAAASAVGADLILFAEGALHGYDYDLTPDLLAAAAEPIDGPGCREVVRIARTHGCAVLTGFMEADGTGFYNSVLVARPDGTVGVQRKHILTAGEKKAGLAQGPAERTVFEFNAVRVAVVICADCSIPGLYDALRAQGVEYRLCPTGGGGKIQDMLHEDALLTPEGRQAYTANRPRVFKTEAILSVEDCPLCGFTAANALGPAGVRTCHQGHCMIVDNQRVMRAQIPGTIVLEHQQDQMIHADLTFP